MSAIGKRGRPGPDRTQQKVASRPTAGTKAAPPGELYIINLKSSVAPLPLVTLKLADFDGLIVFRSRKVEDGRERFRLHLGYFDTERLAEKALPQVREQYPEAWVGPAPKSDMGSLEDTMVAKFEIVAPPEPPRAPVPPTLFPESRPLPVPSQLAPSLVKPSMAASRAGMVAAPPSAARVAAPPTAPRVAAPPSATPRVEAPAPAAAPRVEAPAPVAAEAPTQRLQHFAVQLLWSRQPIDQRRTARLSIFEDYLLYRVETTRDGERWYGLRAGFFQNAGSAKLIAQYARTTFRDVAVVPVSSREKERAAAAATIEVDGSRVRRSVPGSATAPSNASGARLARELALDLGADPTPAAESQGPERLR